MENNIPYFDFSQAISRDREQLNLAFKDVLDSSWFVLGKKLEEFENSFAKFCASKHGIGVGTGLDAISLALQALGIGEGDEVLVCAHGYIATWLAIKQAGATVVPVDAEPKYGYMNLEELESKITSKTKCILPVHLYGHPERLDDIQKIADKFNLFVVDDAAQAHGARIRDKMIGGMCDATAFSFYPSKNLGALGDGGAVTTNSDVLDEKVRLLRNYGSKVRYYNEIIGTNSRLDELQAAFLNVRLKTLEKNNTARQNIAQKYIEALNVYDDVRIVKPRENTISSWHIVPVWTKYRNELVEHLKSDGIGTLIHYPIPPHKSSAFLEEKYGQFPVAEEIAQNTVSLPVSPFMDDETIQRVINSLKDFFSNGK